MVAMRREKVWLRGRADLAHFVEVLETGLQTYATKRQAKPFALALVPAVTTAEAPPDGAERLDLVLGFSGEQITLDRFEVPADGSYPIRATQDPEMLLDGGEAVMVRLLSRFGNPRSHLIELIERYSP
jgi:hypothetical protein